MTDITLEQRVRELLAEWRAKANLCTDPDPGVQAAGAALEVCADELEAALRLSAPPDRIVLWSRNVSPHWFFMARLSNRPPMEGSPVYETMDPVVLQGSPEALRLAAGADDTDDAHEIAAMAENVVTDDATLALLVRLRRLGEAGNEGADLIEWFIDQRSAGEEYVIRADKEHPVGAIYTGVEMVGEIVRLVPTGRRIQG